MADAPTTPEPTPAADPAPQPTPPIPAAPAEPTEPTGDGKGGKDAVLADLAKERDKRQALEQRLSAAEQASKDQLDAIAKALGLKDDAPDPAAITKELEDAQRTAAENAAALTRFQLAVEKSVPAHLVEFVTGSTRDEVEASITKVLAAFGTSTAPGTPKPDPSQGQLGAPTSLDALIAAAEQAGNTREVIRLKARKGLNPA